jgi:hypothetical protein
MSEVQGWDNQEKTFNSLPELESYLISQWNANRKQPLLDMHIAIRLQQTPGNKQYHLWLSKRTDGDPLS